MIAAVVRSMTTWVSCDHCPVRVMASSFCSTSSSADTMATLARSCVKRRLPSITISRALGPRPRPAAHATYVQLHISSSRCAFNSADSIYLIGQGERHIDAEIVKVVQDTAPWEIGRRNAHPPANMTRDRRLYSFAQRRHTGRSPQKDATGVKRLRGGSPGHVTTLQQAQGPVNHASHLVSCRRPWSTPFGLIFRSI